MTQVFQSYFLTSQNIQFVFSNFEKDWDKCDSKNLDYLDPSRGFDSATED